MVNNNIKFIYSLTPMQEGMLYHTLIDEQSAKYILQTRLRMIGNLNIEKVMESLSLLSEKYEILRTMFFYKKASRPWQVVLHERKIEFNVINLSQKNGLEEEITKIQQADIQRGFDLENDSLLRVTILRKSEEENILLWSSHHIIIDGWSLSLLSRDFLQYYEALVQGKTLSFMQEKLKEEQKGMASYREYVKWIEEQDKEEGLHYWENLLEGYSEVADIPSLGRYDNVKEQAADEVYAIDTQLSERLQEICSMMNITISTMVETVWGILLQKYNHSSDVVFGKVVSGRNADIHGIEQAAGLFINTIPTRVKCKESTTVEELIMQTQQQSIESMKYDYCPLSEVQSKSALGNNLIKTLFVFENYYTDESAKKGISGINIEVESLREQTNYGITLQALLSKSLILKISFDTDKFTREEVKTLLGRIELLLQQITDRPEITVSELSFDLQEVIPYSFNADSFFYPRDKSISQLFEEQVERTPDNIAVVYENEQITYQELNNMANHVAMKLRSMGVNPNDYVGIITERSIEMFAGIYGIIKAGGAYVPIDTACPEERLKYMLEDCKPKAVLLGKINKEYPIRFPVVDLTHKALYEGICENPENVNGQEDILYLIYTSGTTGNPKGVMNLQKGVKNLIYWMQSQYPLKENDAVLQKTAYTFDVSVTEVLWWNFVGARVVVLKQGAEMSPSEICNTIHNNKITAINFVPSMLELFLNHLSERKDERIKVKSLRYVFAAGEALNVTIVNEFNRIFAEEEAAKLVNLYGPTEASIYSSYYNCTKNQVSIPIGKPIGNTQLYILNGMQRCGMGIPGELCIAGEGVAKGYLNQEELTKKNFIENPFGAGMLYRTGDLAKWMQDGNIEYLGRIDDQVKIRGFRIELKEVETVLRNCNGVTSAAVIVTKHAGAESSISAYFAAKNALNLKELRKEMQKHLPDYMLPEYFMQLESIPVNTNGKIDRKALPDPKSAVRMENAYQPPSNQIERKLVEIWQEVLNVEQIGVNDDIQDLGGHSLKLISIIGKMASVGLSATIADIYHYRTISALSGYIIDRRSKNSTLESIEELISYIEKETGSYFEWETVMVRQKEGNIRHYNVLYSNFENGCSPEKIMNLLRGKVTSGLLPHYIVSAAKKDEIADKAITEEEFFEKLGILGVDESIGYEIAKQFDQSFILNDIRIKSGNVRQIYPFSPFQNILEKFSSPMNSMHFVIDEYVDLDALQKAYVNLLKEQSLLRSTLFSGDKGPCWKEYELNPDNPPLINLIDLSELGLCYSDLQKILSAIKGQTKYWGESILYNMVLIRKNLREHIIFMVCNHSICDRASMEIIERHIINNYRRLIRSEALEDSKSEGYSSFSMQIMKGPENITTDEIVNKFRLVEYLQSKNKLIKLMEDRKCIESTSFLVAVPVSDQSLGTALTLFVRSLGRYVGMDRLPLRFIFDSRKLDTRLFYNTIGDFGDLVPLLLDVSTEGEEHNQYVINILNDICKYNINFLNFMTNQRLAANWQKIKELTDLGEGYGDIEVLMFNYLGNSNMDNSYKDFYDETVSTGPNPLSSYAMFNTITAAYKDGLIYSMRCCYQIDIEKLRNIFNEEAKLLIGK